ncbi:MAG: DUF6328 family protein [Gordonia sp. (in: high G+C Gram-positive bacteria)]|uniref:DUF6328 family protein n=1 Tax=Gordonia sp. (in: high G+C Gram-positive bacteria) TaxID=84139 RepID=UPI003BB4C26C
MGSRWRRMRLLPPPIDPASDDRWDARARGETPVERLDRNLNVLVQELRVLQTGVQVLAGFLLIIPFQSRFGELGDVGVGVYLATVTAGLLAVIFLLAPMAMHRALFRRHQLSTVVAVTHRDSLRGLACLAAALAGSSAIVVLVATGSRWGAAVAASAVAVASGWLWVIAPLRALWGLQGESIATGTSETPDRDSAES